MAGTLFLAVQTVALVALAVFVAVQRANTAARFRRLEAARREQAAAEQRLRAKLLDLEGEVADLRERPAPASEPVGPTVFAAEPVLTLNKRSQALKMLRKGEAPEAVAKAVGVPRNHIRLLVRVREMIE